VARKGDLQSFKHYNVAMDKPLALALEQSARRNERRLTEEIRYAVRKHLGLDAMPAYEPRPGLESAAPGDGERQL
jgi:hypothetical protein